MFRSAMRVQMAGGSSQTNERDELAEWLAHPPVPTEDPLRWWLANRKLYPCLSRMAVDVHAIPGKSSSIVSSYADDNIQLRL